PTLARMVSPDAYTPGTLVADLPLWISSVLLPALFRSQHSILRMVPTLACSVSLPSSLVDENQMMAPAGKRTIDAGFLRVY
ncbi:MAG: hypothetical protein O2856_11060, partial [Planctomycetota bacterium]|nr:hypothetical protein [Planctomycetota bacterium]